MPSSAQVPVFLDFRGFLRHQALQAELYSLQEDWGEHLYLEFHGKVGTRRMEALRARGNQCYLDIH